MEKGLPVPAVLLGSRSGHDKIENFLSLILLEFLFGVATAIFGILERVIYRWKGLENTFPMVYYAPLKLWKKDCRYRQSDWGPEAAMTRLKILKFDSARVSFWCSDCNFSNLGACNIPLERS